MIKQGCLIQYPYQKLSKAEKVRLNKQMSYIRIEIIIGRPTSKCPLEESKT